MFTFFSNVHYRNDVQFKSEHDHFYQCHVMVTKKKSSQDRNFFNYMLTEHLTGDMFPLVAARCHDSKVYLAKMSKYIICVNILGTGRIQF